MSLEQVVKTTSDIAESAVSGAAVGAEIGSYLPGVGTFIGGVIGFFVGLGEGLEHALNVLARPEFAREMLAVFRCYPNVLRDWVLERESAGISTEASWARTRWGYIAALRKAAGEKGPDILENESWQKRFEAGKAKLPRCKRWPNLKKLGFDPKPEELALALAELRVSLAGLPIASNAIVVKGGLMITARDIVPVLELAKARKQYRQLPTLLFAYKGSIPLYITLQPPVSQSLTRQAEIAAEHLDFTYQNASWFRDATAFMGNEGPAIRVEVRGDLPPGVNEASLASVVGLPVVLSRSTSTMLWFAGGATAVLVGGIAAAAVKRGDEQ